MPYCTQQDLIDRFGEKELIELTDEHNVDEIDATRVNQAIADSDAFIESYIAARFTVPIDPAPAILVQIACDIVRYRLYDDMATDRVSKRFNDAVASLRDIGSGKMSLGVDDPAPQSAGDVEYKAPDRQFTHDSLKDF